MSSKLHKRTVCAKRKAVRTLLPTQSTKEAITQLIFEVRAERARLAWQIRKLKAHAKAEGVLI